MIFVLIKTEGNGGKSYTWIIVKKVNNCEKEYVLL